jgi:hypothetical protein
MSKLKSCILSILKESDNAASKPLDKPKVSNERILSLPHIVLFRDHTIAVDGESGFKLPLLRSGRIRLHSKTQACYKHQSAHVTVHVSKFNFKQNQQCRAQFGYGLPPAFVLIVCNAVATSSNRATVCTLLQG